MQEPEPQPPSVRELERLRRQLRVQEAERRTVGSSLEELRADVERMGASNSWRSGHASAKLAARLLRHVVPGIGGARMLAEPSVFRKGLREAGLCTAARYSVERAALSVFSVFASLLLLRQRTGNAKSLAARVG